MKTCSKCKVEKPIDGYHKDAKAPNGVKSSCKECYSKFHTEYYAANTAKVKDKNRRLWLQRKYNITLEQFDDLKNQQNGCCAICGTTLNDGYHVHVDHDHKTGDIRGILCRWCNTALGNFRDSQENLTAALKYLQKHQK